MGLYSADWNTQSDDYEYHLPWGLGLFSKGKIIGLSEVTVAHKGIQGYMYTFDFQNISSYEKFHNWSSLLKSVSLTYNAALKKMSL